MLDIGCKQIRMARTWCSFPVVPALLFLAAAGIVLNLIKKRSKTSASSPSSSSSVTATTQPLPAAEYEVFLSFRGPEVRTTFADCLYTFLCEANIRTFLDDVELRKGEKMAPALVKAIEESKIFIPILSPDYASSKWCLLELALMVKCWKQGNGHIIVPVFYKMEPRAVRHHKGSYEKAFQQHSKNFDAKTIKEWKEALTEVGNLKGWPVNESDGQGAVIHKVFKEVWSHLTRDYMLATDVLIGIDSHVKKVKELLELAYEGVKVVGICGMGGIGKTTIAKAVFNEVHGQFDRYCFVENVRETLLTIEGTVTLQKKIIHSILRGNYTVINNDEGLNLVADRISKRKVLIVLDDVDDKFEFVKILGEIKGFCSGSRFIITTRDKSLFPISGRDKSGIHIFGSDKSVIQIFGRDKSVIQIFGKYDFYEAEEMSEDNSLQLFSRHAFGMDHPPEEDVALSMKFVQTAAGLPLSLKVIGSLLYRRDKSLWEATLKQLADVLHSDVQETLRISFLALTEAEKQIFLDIACLFIGEEEEQPSYMWDSCGYHPVPVIATLLQRSLIKLNKNYDKKGANERNVFWMHDHIRDLGRTIVREEDRRPWKRSRVWSNEDALNMLFSGEGTDRLEVLKVDLRNQSLKLTKKQFEKLSGLRYLQVYHGEFEGGFEEVLTNIHWLQLSHCVSLPTGLNMRKLIIFNLMSSSVRDDWSGWEKMKAVGKLKAIRLQHSSVLAKAPDLSQCGDLELVNFDMCGDINGEFDVSNLRKLKVLQLVDTKITELAGQIGMLQNLEEIRVINSKLTNLPTGIGNLPSLSFLEVSSRSPLKLVPILPTSLKWLHLSSPSIPNLLDLKDLEELWLNDYEEQFPGDIWVLSKLKFLKLSSFCCESLLVEEEVGNGMGVPWCLPSSLNRLEIQDSKNLERLPSLANLNNLIRLVLDHTGLHEILGLKGLRMLEILQIKGAPNLKNLDGLPYLKLIKELIVRDCRILAKLPGLWNLSKLQKLEICGCPLISQVSGIENLNGLTRLLIDETIEIPLGLQVDITRV